MAQGNRWAGWELPEAADVAYGGRHAGAGDAGEAVQGGQLRVKIREHCK